MTTLQEKFRPTNRRPYEVLSFVDPDGAFWAPEVTGVYSDDCANGRFYARELVAYMRTNNAPSLLAHVVAAIGDRSHTGVEIGFFQALSEALLSAERVPAV